MGGSETEAPPFFLSGATLFVSAVWVWGVCTEEFSSEFVWVGAPVGADMRGPGRGQLTFCGCSIHVFRYTTAVTCTLLSYHHL